MNEELLSISQKVGHDEYEIVVADEGFEIKRNGATHMRDVTPAQLFNAIKGKR